MEKQKNLHLNSLSIFYPFLNDAGTVERQIEYAYKIGVQYADNLEVIAIHGGNSKDNTFDKIKEMSKRYPNLKIIDKTDNAEGYAVIKYGFYNATKEWVFYTDGDAQYHIEEDLEKLIKRQSKTNADVINGYKKHRDDSYMRTFMGNIYKKISRKVFNLPIRDTDCDFRLIRKNFFDKINLESQDASILSELIKKLELAGAKFSEVQVSHYRRVWGKSNYTLLSLFKEKLIGDIKLYLKMKNIKKI